MLPSKSPLLELTQVLHLLRLVGAASLSWRVPDGKYSPPWIEGFKGKTKQLQVTPAVPGSANSLCHTSCTPCLGARRAPSAKRCAPAKAGMVQGLGRRRDTPPAVSLTFWVCCLRKQWECCNVCNASLARLFLSFFLH